MTSMLLSDLDENVSMLPTPTTPSTQDEARRPNAENLRAPGEVRS